MCYLKEGVVFIDGGWWASGITVELPVMAEGTD